MKKIISILLLTLTFTVFNSCIIVADPDSFATNYYNITCYNDTNTWITDWCVVRNGNKTFAKDKYKECSIGPDKSATLYDLPEGEYVLYVAFVRNPDFDYGDYIETRTFTLNKDFKVHIDDTYLSNY